ncbi:hypothetical protein PRK78_000278 [Emydomyces testavorans]|uniref:N-acetyltransferase domain-containing protein n=1 Tax=Emydomyces testavorans TaxID=2070801 RepID=A0AAF0IFF2_9EURO|nr:hypothetical protein PRK78_000278 [Emydomyces testavorans]
MTPHLQFNPTTNEPFLPVPFPQNTNTNTAIILTPYRPAAHDADHLIHSLNDPLIYRWLLTPPVPYTRAHAEQWMHTCTQHARSVLAAIQERADDNGNCGRKKWANGCPVRVIREVRRTDDDGGVEEVFLGDVAMSRHTFYEVRDEEERAERKRVNDEREAGDEEITGSSPHHGKGIMTAALKALIDWAVINMNVHHIRALVSSENIGSCRVFEKNGFVLLETLKDVFVLPEIKGGGTDSIHVFGWTRADN